jgi:primosomal protein N' (replication factor Y)
MTVTKSLPSELPVASVIVDTGVAHLGQFFDYLVPASLSEKIDIGTRVQVPFNSQEREGIVHARRSAPEVGQKLKSISKVLSPDSYR